MKLVQNRGADRAIDLRTTSPVRALGARFLVGDPSRPAYRWEGISRHDLAIQELAGVPVEPWLPQRRVVEDNISTLSLARLACDLDTVQSGLLCLCKNRGQHHHSAGCLHRQTAHSPFKG